MKITQEPKFQPITIVLETKEEAERLFYAVKSMGIATKEDAIFINQFSNWFRDEAQL